MPDTPEIGLHFDVPEAVYFSWNAVNKSTLEHVCEGRTLAHARHEILHPSGPTPAKELGTAVHHAVLLPELFESEYVLPPKVDRRTKKGKLEWKEFEEANPGKVRLSRDDWDLCLGMRDAAWSNPLIAEILGGERFVEVAAVWEDPETGILCKGRIDVLTTWGEWTVVADLKSTKNAAPRAFARDVANYGYHRQGAFYPAARACVLFPVCGEQASPLCRGVRARSREPRARPAPVPRRARAVGGG
jgi:exodeoxyribonuclease VIII